MVRIVLILAWQSTSQWSQWWSEIILIFFFTSFKGHLEILHLTRHQVGGQEMHLVTLEAVILAYAAGNKCLKGPPFGQQPLCNPLLEVFIFIHSSFPVLSQILWDEVKYCNTEKVDTLIPILIDCILHVLNSCCVRLTEIPVWGSFF